MKQDNFFRDGMLELLGCVTDKDYGNLNYEIIYRSGDDYRLVKIPFENIKHRNFTGEFIDELTLNVKSESISNPEIEFAKLDKAVVKAMTMTEAVDILTNSSDKFFPFFNNESNYLNIVYKKGSSVEALVPAF